MRWIAAGMLVVASIARATTADEMTACSLKADLYAAAAEMRDQGQPPQEAAKWLGSYKGKYMSGDAFKATINTVYFDPTFAQAGGMPLRRQMLDICLNGSKPAWQPLK